jgi:hypothetical protein
MLQILETQPDDQRQSMQSEVQMTEPNQRQLDLTFEDQENKENQSQNIIPQSLQVIKAD